MLSNGCAAFFRRLSSVIGFFRVCLCCGRSLRRLRNCDSRIHTGKYVRFAAANFHAEHTVLSYNDRAGI